MLMVITINPGDVKPPIGVVLFTLVIPKDLPITTIYKGVMLFVRGTVFGIVVIFLFPALATWLPKALH